MEVILYGRAALPWCPEVGSGRRLSGVHTFMILPPAEYRSWINTVRKGWVLIYEQMCSYAHLKSVRCSMDGNQVESTLSTSPRYILEFNRNSNSHIRRKIIFQPLLHYLKFQNLRRIGSFHRSNSTQDFIFRLCRKLPLHANSVIKPFILLRYFLRSKT